jgi:hypothetical protein
MRNSLIALLCLLFSSLSQAALIPTMEFSHAAPFSGFQLSPDGKAVAYIEAINGENLLRILNLETNTGATVEFNNKYKQKYGYEVVGQWWEDAAAFLEKHMPANR